jgi:hypothetical protein
MSIVFDEVHGSVEPRDAARSQDAARDDAPRSAEPSEADDARFDRWLRRRAWLEARRFAD